MSKINSNRIRIPFVDSRFDNMAINKGERSGSMVDCCIMFHQHISRDMRFPTKWYPVCATSKVIDQPAQTQRLNRAFPSRLNII